MSICIKRLIVNMIAALLFVAAQRHSFAGSATWSGDPVSSDWTTAQNWKPSTVPNGPADVAAFGPSSTTEVEIVSGVEVDSVHFMPGAPPFTIGVEGVGINLVVSGEGLLNESGSTQSFTTGAQSAIFFFDQATAGEMTSFVGVGGEFIFLESASAGSASFDVSNTGSFVGEVSFSDTSTAADSTISVNNRGNVSFGDSATAADAVITATSIGDVLFGTSSSAGTAVITLSGDSHVSFTQSATADHSHFTAEGAASSSEPGAVINVGDNATAGEATFVLEGGSVAGARGAVMTFFNEGTAGNAAITVNGGVNGGRGAMVLFQAQSDGGTASLALFASGKVDFSPHLPESVTVGSVEGDGQVVLGANAVAVGSNNQSTTFSGVIQDGHNSGGSLSKTGSGVLSLSGANLYTGGTTVEAGTLLVQSRGASATGTGPVQVNGGTLGGRGKMAGSVTIGSGSGGGAFLAPGVNGPAGLTTQGSLSFNSDGTYNCQLDTTRAKADKVSAKGVTIQSGARFAFSGKGTTALPAGTVFTVIDNRSRQPINGTFANLPEGSTFTANGNNFQASYEGGNGNDLTLTVVP